MEIKQINIVSKDNEKIKSLRKLGQRKFRDKLSQFLVENLSIIHDAAKAGIYPEALFVTEGFIAKNEAVFRMILEKAGAREYYLISPALNASFSNLEQPSGVCAVYAKPERKIEPEKSVVYLNGISDPGNLGTILRSALAFSLVNIIIDEKSADAYSPKTIQAAKDAIFKVNIEFDKGRNILRALRKKMPVFATDVTGGKDIAIIKNKRPFCIVLGSEARGVDREIQNLSDDLVTIKISQEAESLNVAGAAAIIFYELGDTR